ncbi:SAM-dependent methyltransferase [Methylogaea oryzae]|uniref:SAM-dependent methyltransferase n=1 Tax=Methylogaea oryzae TaxID=1295382 RepID=A0A8D5AI68_9GAMM|nr:class I SAM-dependent methyltransferase [Methylogaea oryzae]BBL69419.1 SAM-dependent methyltransferase [Methylogaea oryzae]
MWDERYSAEEYAYSKEPNQFLAENYRAIPKGRVLSLAEGEGRNAVFLAEQGYSVTAVDGSAVGLKKAEKLAGEHGVEVEWVHADLAEYAIGDNAWDGIVSIFCPLPSALRSRLYKAAVAGLKPGGVFLLEAYTPEQLLHDTGGGKSADAMTTKASLLADLDGLRFIHLEELERNVVEGVYHTGLGAVVQAIAVKAA